MFLGGGEPKDAGPPAAAAAAATDSGAVAAAGNIATDGEVGQLRSEVVALKDR
jgi:hypothetical protein